MKKAAMIIWILSVLLIIAGSLLPHFGPPESYHLDKVIHGSAYAALAFLSFFFSTKRKVIFLFLITIIALGGAIEILQSFIPERSGTIGDFAADFIGVLAGALIAVKLKPVIIKWFSK